MSISRSSDKPNEIIKNRLIKRAAIRKAAEKVSQALSKDPLNFILIMMYVVTGIGNLFSCHLSIAWYIFLAIITIIFFVEKYSENREKEENNKKEPEIILGKRDDDVL